MGTKIKLKSKQAFGLTGFKTDAKAMPVFSEEAFRPQRR